MTSPASSTAPVCQGRADQIDLSSEMPISNCLFRLKRTSPAEWPVVGTSSQLISSSKWYKNATHLGIGAIEINRRHSKLYLNVYFLEKVKRYLRDLSISLHSGTTGVFQELESFTQAELATLRAEVDLARFLGAYEIIFHLNSELTDENRKQRLEQIIDYAKENGVKLIYESDSVLRAHDTCEVLETFPDVGYALDLGHLNSGHRRNLLGCGIDEFISRVRDRTIYIHANNNCGIIDEHKGLNCGSLDWRSVLDLLDIRRIRTIIIEVRSIEYLKDSKDALRDYLVDRLSKTTSDRKCCWSDLPMPCPVLAGCGTESNNLRVADLSLPHKL